MTNPEYPGGPVLEKVYTASTASQMQDIDAEAYAHADNAEVHGSAEVVRNVFFSSVYLLIEEIPIIGGFLGDLIEVLTGVEDGDLGDVGTWVNGLAGLGDIAAGIGGFIGDLLGMLDGSPPGGSGVGDLAATLNGTRTAAESAVTEAQAAANAAAAAVEVADIAYALASYWEAECAVASAQVGLGVNEIRIGLCQNVPTGKTRLATDLHIALEDQPGGMVLQTKLWNATRTASTVKHTATLGANVTSMSYQNLELGVLDKERFFWNVLSVTGSTPPNVLQCLLFGVIFG